jgi:hypothetical protein
MIEQQWTGTQWGVTRWRLARIARVVAARRQGKSLRAIALAERVSEKQIRLDLERAAADGVTAAPPASGVVGRDGKRRRVPARAGRSGVAAAPSPHLSLPLRGADLAPAAEASGPAPRKAVTWELDYCHRCGSLQLSPGVERCWHCGGFVHPAV